MNRLISHTPPLSAETTKVRRRADQGRELVNVLELNNMGEADLVDQPADELGSMLEEGRLVESLRIVQMSAHWSLVGTNSGEEMLSS